MLPYHNTLNNQPVKLTCSYFGNILTFLIHNACVLDLVNMCYVPKNARSLNLMKVLSRIQGFSKSSDIYQYSQYSVAKCISQDKQYQSIL